MIKKVAGFIFSIYDFNISNMHSFEIGLNCLVSKHIVMLEERVITIFFLFEINYPYSFIQYSFSICLNENVPVLFFGPKFIVSSLHFLQVRPKIFGTIALSYPLPYCYWWLIMKNPGWKLFRSPNPNPRGVRKCNNFEAFLKSVGLFFYFLRGGLSHNWWGVVFFRGPEDFQLESLNQSSHILWD